MYYEPSLVFQPNRSSHVQSYWQRNLRIMIALLAVWALVGLGCGVLFADYLNRFSLGGFPLGFWFAQQGSIIVFVVLILIYAISLNRLDQEYSSRIEPEEPPGNATPEDGSEQAEE